MATHQNSIGKNIKPTTPKREIAPAEVEAIAATPAAMETPAPVEPVAPVRAQAATAEDEFIAASFRFDSAEWTKKSFELWSENATALLDLAEQMARAKTLDEIVSLQSRFATDRLDSFLRQSKDVMSFAQSFCNLAATPFYGARAA